MTYGTCLEICLKYKALKNKDGGRYDNGQKRCQGCEIFIKWNGIYCPCCNKRLRNKPRNRFTKERLRSRIIIKEEEEKSKKVLLSAKAV